MHYEIGFVRGLWIGIDVAAPIQIAAKLLLARADRGMLLQTLTERLVDVAGLIGGIMLGKAALLLVTQGAEHLGCREQAERLAALLTAWSELLPLILLHLMGCSRAYLRIQKF